MENKNKNKFLSVLLKVLYYIAIVFVCLIGLFLIYYIITSQINQNNEDYRPKISIYTIVSPSMTPTIEVYDVVINAREDNPENIQVGDIITYISKAPNSEGMTITHRVVEVAQLPDGQYEYMTQGDNNSEPDSLFVTHDQVIGKKIAIIPKLGKVQFLISEKKGWLFLLLIPIAIYIFIDVYKLIKLIKLKNKVNKVTVKEEKVIESKEDKKEMEQQRKEEIVTELKEKELDKKIKTKHESFLEKYEETIIEVKNNKYTTKKVEEPEVVTKQEIEEIEQLDEEDLALFDPLGIFNIENESKEEIVQEPIEDKVVKKPKPKKVKTTVVNEQYEILDTDELTSKIKEYDSKIAELDKMLKDMDKLKENKQEEKKTKKVREENFLKESRIKVVSEEETKNKKRVNKTYVREIEPKKTESKKVEVTLKPVVEKQITEKEKNKKPRLNLDPKDIKTVKRKSTKKDEPAKLPIDELLEKQNNLPKKGKVQKVKNQKIKKPRKPIISIEKVR